MDIGLNRKTSNICDRIRWLSWEKIFSEISNEDLHKADKKIRLELYFSIIREDLISEINDKSKKFIRNDF